MEDMKNYFKDTDMDKLQIMVETERAYHAGEISLEEGRKILREKVGHITAGDIALAEQKLAEFEDDQCHKEDIQSKLDLFQDILDSPEANLAEDHPISRYLQENEACKKILLEIEDLVQYPVIKNQWLDIYDRLREIKKHHSRKHMQLYPMLEQKGFDRPTTTMWTLDDSVREEIGEARGLLEADNDDAFIEKQATIVADVRDLMQKEETVLYPTSLKMISPEEFETMKSGDAEIGYAWIDVDVDHRALEREHADQSTSPLAGLGEDLAALLAKHGIATGADAELDMATGKLTLEQINLILRNLPLDISFVDENEIVKFYSDTDHRIFPRSRNVIGRDVKNCHPRASVHIVQEIVEKFRSGEEDHVDFWINKPGMFIYIYYKAVRDDEGNFRGVLEMMQDCTHIRDLSDSRTLLTWEDAQGDTNASGSDDSTETVEGAGNNGSVVLSHTEATNAGNTTGDTSSNAGINADSKADVTTNANADPDQSPLVEPEDGAYTGSWNADTKLADLVAHYPWLRGAMKEINPEYAQLATPLGRIMIHKATLGMISERGGMTLEDLITAIKAKIAEHDAQ